MENLRVYEAARKLNIETAELMARLAARGVTVTGPIDTVTEADLDAVAEELKSAPAKAEASAEPAPAPVLRLAPREEKPATPADDAAPAVEETVAEKAPHHPKTHHTAPAPHHASKASKTPTALASGALALAALALLLTYGLYTTVKEQGAGIATLADRTVATAAAAQDASLNAESALSMSVNNGNRLTQLDRRVAVAEQARLTGELTRRSAALGELAPTLPGAQAERVAAFARRLEALARAL
ncbi:MAG: translation initiation factor IF-2 N-terminal domain-containing protein [Nitrospinae bacterium]|nr:translation initiation factor IF-2 N-terminal domain-containing protein [Nitrospinota bacterium]